MKKLFFLLVAGLVFGAGICGKEKDEVDIYFKNSDMTPGLENVHVSLNGGNEQKVPQGGDAQKIGVSIKAGESYTLKLTRGGGTVAELSSPCPTTGKERQNVTVNWKGGQDFSCE